jgi:FkbM family methyltransferase
MKKIIIKALETLSLKDAAVQRWYNYKSKKFYSSIVHEGDLVFDVGANIGNRSASFLALGTKVVAFEPQARCVNILKRRFENNSNIIIEKLGLADANGEIKLTISSNSSVIASMSDKWINEGRFSKNTDWDNFEMVNVSTLDQMIDKHGTPKFCKIDVEGFELNVLKGLTKPIEYISFEFTKEFFSDAVACIKHLERISPIEINFSIGETMKYQNSQYLSIDACLKQIESIEDKDLWGDIYIRMKK